ncbi:MAG: pyruvate kinase [Treponema sp.]|jgi:pyruvate kinase|nr:pyruvate kinase [Treponema sp.]
MNNRKTKIVCSLGPASSEDSVVRGLILAGMNVARLNFSHGTPDEHRASVERVRRVSDELGMPVAIMLDTKGPEIRTGMVENDGKITIKDGDNVVITTDGCFSTAAGNGTPARISLSWKEAEAKLKQGHRVLVADGLLELEVIDTAGGIKCRANNTAVIGSKKNVNLIGVHANLPIMSEKDKEDIEFGISMDMDYIAASFLSFPHEVTDIKKFLESHSSHIKIIAKIESGEGLENIKEIARLADGVMVARGDLGVQLPTEQIPLAQKHIISVCRRAGKPVITATQMLESMIVNPRPTRAELTDVANAILDGTDAVMLSGETSAGAYPIEAVKTMDKIARVIEQSDEFRARMKKLHDECHSEAHNQKDNLGVIMSRYGVEIATAVKAKAIVTPTRSGNTARILSIFKPDEPVLAVTTDKRSERVMQLYWGVNTCIRSKVDDSESMINDTMKVVTENKVAGLSDKVILVAGLPLESPNMINNVRVVIIGTVLARSNAGGFANPAVTRAQGRIFHAATPDEARRKIMSASGEILVCKELTEEYASVISAVSGIICDGVSVISEQKLALINPNLVWLTHMRDAARKLESGLTVTIDGKELLVYEGTI